MDDRDTPRVLIVDDQPRNLDVLEVMLEGMECLLVRAESADAALLHVVRHDFAALIIDIKMPGMNGIELAALIKQRKRSRHVPILLLTAHQVDENDVLLGYGAGACGSGAVRAGRTAGAAARGPPPPARCRRAHPRSAAEASGWLSTRSRKARR